MLNDDFVVGLLGLVSGHLPQSLITKEMGTEKFLKIEMQQKI